MCSGKSNKSQKYHQYKYKLKRQSATVSQGDTLSCEEKEQNKTTTMSSLPTMEAISELAEIFPSWDEDALRDVLSSTNNNIAMATELIIEWTEEETSGGKGVVQHNPEDMETNDEGLIVELPNALLERDDYDNVLASRIVRKAPKTGDFVKSLLVVERVRAKAHAVHDMLEKKKHTWSVKSFFAHKPKKHLEYDIDHFEHLSRNDAILEGIKLLEERLKFLNLRTIKSEDDGNCQFRSLSNELYGTQDFHYAIRIKVCEFMKEHVNDFSPFIGTIDDFNDYIEKMMMNRTWGDELTLRAASDIFGTKIHVITTEKEHYVLHYDPSTTSKTNRQLFLSYISPIHYNTVSFE